MSLESSESYCFVCGLENINYDMETGNHYCRRCDTYLCMVNGVKNE